MGNRKEEILIVALHLFARDGYEAVSVSQIAGELDMTKGALYRHYKSKRDIFDCIVQRMEQRMVNRQKNMICHKREKKKCLNSMRQYHWMILWNTASQCLNIGQRMILHHRFGRC